MAVRLDGEIGGIPHFDCTGEPTSIGVRWKKWRRAFEFFVEGKGVTNPKQKKSLLLHCGGMALQDVYSTLPPAAEPEEDENVYTVAMDQLDQYFTPQVNVPYERHMFRSLTQEPSESIDQFVTRLLQKADFCDFGDKRDENIRDQVIEKCSSNRLRTKLLERGTTLTLQQLQTIARSMEASATQAENMAGSQPSHEVNKVQHKYVKNKVKKDSSGKKCYRCGKHDHLSNDEKCPARGKKMS